MARRIIALSSQLPWPLNSGGHLRTFHIQKALSSTFDCELIVPVRPSELTHLEELKDAGIHIFPVFVPERNAIGEFQRLIRAFNRSLPYSFYGRHFHRPMLRALQARIRSSAPDLLWLDHLDSFQYFPFDRAGRIPLMLDLHNIYSLIVARLSLEQTSLAKKFFLQREAKLLATREKTACKQVDTVITVSTKEANHYRSLSSARVVVAPNGVEIARFSTLRTGRDPKPLVLLFLGLLNWGPNVDAAKKLAQEIFPAIRRVRADAQLLLVGKDPCQEVRRLASQSGIRIEGNVENILPFMKAASLMLVPLESGGGTRLKILEAMASGLPVVSTAIGAEGLGLTHNKNIVIAEIGNMAAAVLELVRDQALMASIAEEGRSLVRNEFDWKNTGERCIGAAHEAIERS